MPGETPGPAVGSVVLTQLPRDTDAEKEGPRACGMMPGDWGAGARIVLWEAGRPLQVLTGAFDGACDPSLSFDGRRMVFAGRERAQDDWQIYEMHLDGSNLRRITRGPGHRRQPSYQSALYTIVSAQPWHQITFVDAPAGWRNEIGAGPVSNLYSCKLDGTGLRRLTGNLSANRDPVLLDDGRLLFASWQRSTLQHGPLGYIGLFGVNIDGADYAIFAGRGDKRIGHMPCATTGGLVVFVEADRAEWDGAGTLGSVTLRRPLHSYRPITRENDGLFHSPSARPDGAILVSRRRPAAGDTHGVYVLDPDTGDGELLFDDPQYHDIQAKAVVPRDEPDGRSSVVSEEDPDGTLYCLNVYLNDLKPQWLPAGSVRQLRVIEGLPVPRQQDESPGGAGTSGAAPLLAPRRILGQIPVQPDGSFQMKIPAGIPVELQILDDEAMALRTCSWIWAQHHEPRGCIGCHEDPELTPENVLVEALKMPAVSLTLPQDRRRTVTYKADVAPIVSRRCANCHGSSHPSLVLAREDPAQHYAAFLRAPADAPAGSTAYVQAGSARTSRLIWRLYGRNTSRPWDGASRLVPAPPLMPPPSAAPLTKAEKQTVVEWIDLGAMWEFPAGSPPAVSP